VPPPEVTPPPNAEAPAITTQVEPPREPVKIEPPPPAPAPPAPKSDRVEVSVACPGYVDVLRNSLGAIRDKVGIDGVVSVRIKIRGNQVVEVTPLSGPREYFRPVQNAVRKFGCQASGQEEVVTSLEVVFKEQ
jgi:protein TonB